MWSSIILWLWFASPQWLMMLSTFSCTSWPFVCLQRSLFRFTIQFLIGSFIFIWWAEASEWKWSRLPGSFLFLLSRLTFQLWSDLADGLLLLSDFLMELSYLFVWFTIWKGQSIRLGLQADSRPLLTQIYFSQEHHRLSQGQPGIWVLKGELIILPCKGQDSSASNYWGWHPFPGL